MDYTVKPIVEWPGELTNPAYREHDRFKTSHAKTLILLDKEISHLGGTNVVIQLALNFGQIRMDGRPYADANPEHPGVVITFNCEEGPLSFHTDKYRDWHANVRAIALALEALRKIDRYGVNKKGSQYRGYLRLPAAGETTNGFKLETAEEAANWFAEKLADGTETKDLLRLRALVQPSYKTLAQRFHPDNRETASEQDFIILQDALVLLKKHHDL